MYDINQKRLIKTFTDLAKISSPSWEEKEVIDYITKKLKNLNVKYKKIKCNNSYNLLAVMEGNDKKKQPMLFAAHTDTVQPCKNIKPVVTEKKITSDGTSILGSDDKSAIAMFLESISYLQENNVPHGKIEFLFTCAEEIGLEGIKKFDMKQLTSKIGFVFDCDGPIGKLILKSPYHVVMDIAVKGKAAHAGLEPEKGINAINILAEIITNLPSGRLDNETTMNTGLFNGGRATNIVAEEAFSKIEFRSISKTKVKDLESKSKKLIKSIAAQHGAKVKINVNHAYSGFTIESDSKIVQLTEKALERIKIKSRHEASGGGSDTNIINKAGIKAINLSSGMQKVHSTNEFILIKDLVNGTKLVISLIESV